MIEAEIILLAIGAVFLFIVYYVLIKDGEHVRQVRAIVTAVEECSREIYILEKKILEMQKMPAFQTPGLSDEEIYTQIERGIYDFTNPFTKKVLTLEENLSELAATLDGRLTDIEGGIRQIAMPSSIYGNDDGKITSLFKEGMSIGTIAKELHLSKAEVEFVLKINQLR